MSCIQYCLFEKIGLSRCRKRIGAIAVGMDTNLTIMNKKLEVQGTLVQGNWAYKILSDD